jgi:hypothetical protein
MKKLLFLMAFLGFISVSFSADVKYRMDVSIDNQNSYIRVKGSGLLSEPVKHLEFYLNENLNIKINNDNINMIEADRKGIYKKYILTSEKKFKKFKFQYEGAIYYPLSQMKEYQRGFRRTSGLISDKSFYYR